MSVKKKINTQGFTIVELLIVIVVIAILAAISIVAYNGIQGRTNDTVIKSDLSRLGKQLKLMQVDLGTPPPGGAVRSGGTDTGDFNVFSGVVFYASKESYYEPSNNLYYCTGTESSGETSFRIIAKSKSGTTFKYSSNGSIQDIGSSTPGSTLCLADYSNAGSWATGRLSGSWRPWVQ